MKSSRKWSGGHPGQNICEQLFALTCPLQQNQHHSNTHLLSSIQIMNLLRTTTLVAIFIKCVAASDDYMPQFRRAVDGGDVAKAVELDPWIPSVEAFNYVVDKQNQEFIFKFAKEVDLDKYILLAALHRKNSPEMIRNAFKRFTFSQKT